MADNLKTDPTLPDLKAKEVAEAKKDGIKQAIAEGAAAQFKQTDGIPFGDEPKPAIIKTNDAMHMGYLLDLQPDVLTKTLKGEGDLKPIPTQGQIASLLEMERSGKNRTDVVQALCDVLGIDSPYEVTDAGPAWTNRVDRDVVKPRG